MSLASCFALLALSPQSPAPTCERLGVHEEAVQNLFFLDGGKRLATSTRSGMVRLWDVRSGKLAGEYRHEDELDQILPSDDDKAIVFVSKSTFGRLDGKDAKFEGSMAHQGEVIRCMVFVPKWRWLFAGEEGGILRRFSSGNLAEPGDTLGTQAGAIDRLAVSADGKCLAAGDAQGGILLLDPVKLDVWAPFSGHTAGISALAFDPNGKTLYSGSLDHSIRVWDVKKYSERAVLEEHEAPVRSLALDAKGKRLASGDDGGIVLVRDTKTNVVLQTLATGMGPITALAFDAKGKRLATPGPENTVALWELP